jgi:hypothetical protein
MNRGGFSWNRLLGISRAKSQISRKIGIPLTKSGRQRKIGKIVTGGGCLIPIIISLFVSLFLILSLIASPSVWAQRTIPRSDFIKMTETALDRMDDIQSLLENGTSKMEANRAKSQLDAAMKKFDRYKSNGSKEQEAILLNLSKAHYGFSLLLATEGNVGSDLVGSKQSAIDLFMIYGNKK